MIHLYNLFFMVTLPLVIISYLYKKRPPQPKRWLRERMGIVEYTPRRAGRKRIWLHAVSVGEALAAVPLIEKLKKDYEFILTTVTPTGREVFLKRFSDLEVFYAPFDLLPCLLSFVRTTNPDIILIMETELWPMLLYTARKRGIPLLILNGRISDHSYKAYRRATFFISRVLKYPTLYLMQTEEYARRIISLGAEKEKVKVVGNIKFDIPLPENPPLWASRLSHPLIVAGSTHEGEESLIIEAFLRLRHRYPSLFMVLAPRHPERTADVEALLSTKNVRYMKRSDLNNDVTEDIEVLILDTVGELTPLYSVADLAIVGGSFVPKGGHNIFEPAGYGVPIVTGPYMQNFPEAEEFYKATGAVKADPEKLYNVINELLSSQDKRDSMGRKAREIFLKNRGATERIIKELTVCLRNADKA